MIVCEGAGSDSDEVQPVKKSSLSPGDRLWANSFLHVMTLIRCPAASAWLKILALRNARSRWQAASRSRREGKLSSSPSFLAARTTYRCPGTRRRMRHLTLDSGHIAEKAKSFPVEASVRAS